jgi:hypothetical protein
MIHSRVGTFILDAVKASLFAMPREHGLTVTELLELGRADDIKQGELMDTLRAATAFVEQKGSRYRLHPNLSQDLIYFIIGGFDGDPRNPKAFQFVWKTFHELMREHGAQNAKIDRSVLLARGTAEGLLELDLDLAVETYIWGRALQEQGGTLLGGLGGQSSPEEQRRQALQHYQASRSPHAGAAAMIEQVRDIMMRRTDRRPPSVEPIAAFAAALDDLKLSGLKAWWNEIAGELRRADNQTSPTSVIVLAAALAEASLCAVISRARTLDATMTGVKVDDPKSWKLVELQKFARRGEKPIIVGDLVPRVDQLNEQRQRIHAGRYWIAGRPANGFDLRPEEARAARETLDQLLRAVLDWLRDNPGPS